MKKRKVCVVTGSRAEYGLLYWLMREIQDDEKLILQIVATGMHLSPEFGLTYREIEEDGFNIDRKVEMLLSADTPSAISKSTGLGINGFADALTDLQPDVMVILGDRFEVFAATFAALVARIPVAHISGGELTEGVIDDSIRHAISKMAYLHFTAAEEYRKRVTQLGEDPERIFNVGGLGVDSIRRANLLEKKKLEKELNFDFGVKNLLVTFHPVTLENSTSETQFSEILTVLESLDDTHLIFTGANGDTDGRVITGMINTFVENHLDSAVAFNSMGRVNYLSTLQYVDAVIGNSSSGLAEAPSFGIGTINIGDRQNGRLKAKSVIDCKPSKVSLIQALRKLYSKHFQQTLNSNENPYDKGNPSQKIVEIIKTFEFPIELKKAFYDL